jgi:hypothetical protein
MSFDPWGRRRNSTDWTFNNMASTYMFDRGYTGHEHLDEFSLINMLSAAKSRWPSGNGRVYEVKDRMERCDHRPIQSH